MERVWRRRRVGLGRAPWVLGAAALVWAGRMVVPLLVGSITPEVGS